MPEYKEKVTAYWWFRWKDNIPFLYRYEAVPGIHKRGRMSDFYRYPRTKQELSSGYIADGDEEFLTAAQINKITKVRDLPNAWDDQPRGDWRDKSWKRHRKTQHLSSERTLSLQ